MAIYFDANLLRDGLTSLWAAAVRAVGRAHKLEIAVPQLVLDEVRSNRQRLIEQRAAQIETAIAFGSGLFKVPIFDRPHPGRLAAEWVHEIQKMVRLIPASDQHAAEALRRELERVPPARESAGRGMGARDCAIWLAIAEDHRSRSEDGYLLSADGAFRDPGSKEPRLHSVLAAELASERPMHLTPGFEDLLRMLATEGGRTFDLDEIRADEKLPAYVRGAVLLSGQMDEAATEFIGPPFTPGIVSKSYGFTSATPQAITQQRVYQLGQGREVAVLETTWLMDMMVRLTSGPQGAKTERLTLGSSATLSLPARVLALVQFWAQREAAGPPTQSSAESSASKLQTLPTHSAASNVSTPLGPHALLPGEVLDQWHGRGRDHFETLPTFSSRPLSRQNWMQSRFLTAGVAKSSVGREQIAVFAA